MIETNNPTRTIPVYPAGPRKEDRLNSNDAIERQKRDGMDWRFASMDDWTTERIFNTFAALGIAMDEARFRELALQYRSTDKLARIWDDHFSPEDLWSDFPFIAVRTLWPRITPDISAPETIANALEACADVIVGPIPNQEMIKSRIKTFADYLEAFPENEIPDQYEAVQRSLLTDIVWICSRAISLFGDDDSEEAARVSRIIQLADPKGSAVLLGDMALIAARQGRTEEARTLLAEQMRQAPNAPETYLAAATFDDQLDDYASMVENSVKALNLEKDPQHWDTIYTSLATMFLAAGHSDELDAVERRIRRPFPPLAPVTRSRIPAQSSRVGRNDPCPCGSGKKYKKCHGA